jgi:hypothetical protein
MKEFGDKLPSVNKGAIEILLALSYPSLALAFHAVGIVTVPSIAHAASSLFCMRYRDGEKGGG